jgi:hypothetical protein
MKKFEFQLQSALDWRQRRLEGERVRLEALETQRNRLQASVQSIEAARHQSQDAVAQSPTLERLDLDLLEGYRHAAEFQTRRLAAEIARLDAAILQQRTRVTEANREHRLLEKLRQQRHDDWQKGVDRQIEDEAAERYLAQWKNQD